MAGVAASQRGVSEPFGAGGRGTGLERQPDDVGRVAAQRDRLRAGLGHGRAGGGPQPVPAGAHYEPELLGVEPAVLAARFRGGGGRTFPSANAVHDWLRRFHDAAAGAARVKGVAVVPEPAAGVPDDSYAADPANAEPDGRVPDLRHFVIVGFGNQAIRTA